MSSSSAITGSAPVSAGSVPLAHTGFGPGLSGYWLPSPSWEFNGSMSYLMKWYSEPSQPGNLERRDKAFGLNARFTYRKSSELAPYLEFDATVNASTLVASSVEDRNYSRFVVLTGLSWDLL